jgi:hypothetical protein
MGADLVGLAQAKKERANSRAIAIKAELAELEREIAEWDDFLSKANLLLESAINGADDELPSELDDEPPSSSESPTVKRSTIAGKLVVLMQEEPHSPTLTPILNTASAWAAKLEKRGESTQSEHFKVAVGNSLRRRTDLFEQPVIGQFRLRMGVEIHIVD